MGKVKKIGKRRREVKMHVSVGRGRKKKMKGGWQGRV